MSERERPLRVSSRRGPKGWEKLMVDRWRVAAREVMKSARQRLADRIGGGERVTAIWGKELGRGGGKPGERGRGGY